MWRISVHGKLLEIEVAFITLKTQFKYEVLGIIRK
jgi:hypothetical protein